MESSFCTYVWPLINTYFRHTHSHTHIYTHIIEAIPSIRKIKNNTKNIIKKKKEKDEEEAKWRIVKDS